MGACPAVGGLGGGRGTWPDPAAAGSDVSIFDSSPDLIPYLFSDPLIQLRPADFIYRNFSRGRALDFIYTNVWGRS